MNTLNNQQINPGNRVDFSRIRRFAKGGVPKFALPAGAIYHWDNFNEMWDDRANAGAATSTSIPWNREYATVSDLENSR
jgi:hypothetical protein